MIQRADRANGARRAITAVVIAAAFVVAISACTAAGENAPKALSAVAGDPAPTSAHQPVTNVRSIDDGYVPGGEFLSPFDSGHPAITKLEPELRSALQHAATDAGKDGVEMVVNSGWRSARYQQALFDVAKNTYGSMEEARKWVNTPQRSAHVTGRAVDVGHTDADSWLSQHGARYGLCQIYANEMWHFELATPPNGACPAQKSDGREG